MNVRRSVAAVAMSLSLLSLAACGEEQLGLEAVKISSEAGKEPKATFEDGFDPQEVEVKVLTKGKGPKITEDDAVTAHLWISNSADKKVPLNTYAEGEQPLDLLLKDLMPGIKKGLVGQQEGAVVAVTGPAGELFSEYGYPEWGIGNGDAVVIRTEIVKKMTAEETAKLKKDQADAEKAAAEQQKQAQEAQAEAEKKAAEAAPKKEKAKASALPAAKGKTVKPAAWAPKVTFPGKDGVPTIDFTGTPKPDGKLQVTQLIKGEGKKIALGDAVVVKYVGQVHGGKEPFDSSYSRGDVLDFTTGAKEMIDGFDTAVQGQRVGSRLIIQIPPSLGYGEQGRDQIKGTDTMVFVVDIVGAA